MPISRRAVSGTLENESAQPRREVQECRIVFHAVLFLRAETRPAGFPPQPAGICKIAGLFEQVRFDLVAGLVADQVETDSVFAEKLLA